MNSSFHVVSLSLSLLARVSLTIFLLRAVTGLRPFYVLIQLLRRTEQFIGC